MQGINNNIERNTENYRPCVGIMVLNHNKMIFCAQRVDYKHHYQMPQGGKEEGESDWDAARRELYEETGIMHIKFLGMHPILLYYDFPKEIRKKFQKVGQVQRWFAVKLLQSEDYINLGRNIREFAQWKWQSRQEVLNHAVSFKRAVYKNVIDHFSYLL